MFSKVPKKLGQKTIWFQKCRLCKKNVGPKKVGAKKKMLGQKKMFGPKKFVSDKNSRIMFLKRIVNPKKNVGPTSFELTKL